MRSSSRSHARVLSNSFRVALTFVPAALCARVDAGQVVHQTTIDLPVPYTQSATLPRFDPQLGFLRGVEVTVGGSLTGSVGIENTNAVPSTTITATALVGSLLVPTLPFGGMAAPNPAFEADQPALAAYDGTTDFGGTSGVTLAFVDGSGTGAPSITAPFFTPDALAAYTGPAGNPGTVTFTINATGSATSGPPGIVRQVLSLSAKTRIEILYNFDAFPTTFCSPLQSSPYPCPCSNYGTFPRGCANSASAQGGLLSTQGQASIATDTLTLLAQGMPDALTLYAQTSTFSYAGFAYGDGLDCLSGPALRLGNKTNVGGASQYPAAGDAPISVQGQITAPGVTRYYQVLYRDNSSFCTTATFNLTNAVAVLWQP